MATSIQSIPTAQIDTVYAETFSSESINQRFRGLGRGIRHGFVPAIGSSNDELELNVDARMTDSVAEIGGTGGQADITIQVREPAQVLLDLSALSADDYYIGIRPGYVTGLTTTATYVAYSEAEVAASTHVSEGSVLLCKVTTTGDVGPLTEIVLADDNFIRDEIRHTGPATDSGLDLYSYADLGDPNRSWKNISLPVDSTVRTGAHTGHTGLGSLDISASLGDSFQFSPELFIPARDGDQIVLELRYQSDSTLNSGSSGAYIVEYSEEDTHAVSTAAIPDTGGDWAVTRVTLPVTQSDTLYCDCRIQLVFSATGLAYLDYVKVYIVRADAGSADGLSSVPFKNRSVHTNYLKLRPALDFGFGVEASVDSDTSATTFTPDYQTQLQAPLILRNNSAGVVTAVADGANSTGFTFHRLNTGSATIRETTLIVCDESGLDSSAGSTQASYFEFNDGSDDYYVWYNYRDNAASDPGLASIPIEVELDVAPTPTDAEVAYLTALAINASGAAVTAGTPTLRSGERLPFQTDGPLIAKRGVRLFDESGYQARVTGEDGSVALRATDGGLYTSGIANNIPLAIATIHYDHALGTFVLEDYSVGLNTGFASSAGVDVSGALDLIRVQLDTSVPVFSEGIVVNATISVNATLAPTVFTSTPCVAAYHVNYTSAVNVTIDVALVDPTTGAPHPFGASEDGVSISLVVYGRRSA